MANRYAVATGNWSNPATWDGGTLPTLGDVVRPNGFTVTIDQSINVNTLTNTSNTTPLIVAGGFFRVSTIGFTLTCDVTAGSFGGKVLEVATGTSKTTIIGKITGGSGVTARGVDVLTNGTVLEIIGEVQGGTRVDGSPSTSSIGCVISNNCFVTLTGDAYAGNGQSYGGTAFWSSTPSSEITIYGNVYNDFPSRTILSSGILRVFGTITNRSNNPTVDLGNAEFILDGVAVGNGTQPAVVAPISSTQAFVRAASIITSFPLGGPVRFLTVNPQFTVLTQTGSVTLTDPAQTNPPVESNVRLGTSYGGGAYIGLLSVPLPSQVSLGTPTDNTVGTGIVTSADFLEAIKTSSDPLAERLRNVATVQTVGDQFNSFSQ